MDRLGGKRGWKEEEMVRAVDVFVDVDRFADVEEAVENVYKDLKANHPVDKLEGEPTGGRGEHGSLEPPSPRVKIVEMDEGCSRGGKNRRDALKYLRLDLLLAPWGIVVGIGPLHGITQGDH